MINIYIVGERIDTIYEEIDFIYSCWGNENNKNFFADSVLHSYKTSDGLPQFFIARDADIDRIVGTCALIRNDLCSRQDLFPWLACLYVIEEYRRRRIGKYLIDFTVSRAKELGFSKLFLETDHDSYYERYGWEFYGFCYGQNGHQSRIYRYLIDR